MNADLLLQVSRLNPGIVRSFRLQTPLIPQARAFGFCVPGVTAWNWGTTPLHSDRSVSGVIWTSPVGGRLVEMRGRIEFTCVADESLPSGCSPPRLMADAVTFGSERPNLLPTRNSTSYTPETSPAHHPAAKRRHPLPQGERANTGVRPRPNRVHHVAVSDAIPPSIIRCAGRDPGRRPMPGR